MQVFYFILLVRRALSPENQSVGYLTDLMAQLDYAKLFFVGACIRGDYTFDFMRTRVQAYRRRRRVTDTVWLQFVYVL